MPSKRKALKPGSEMKAVSRRRRRTVATPTAKTTKASRKNIPRAKSRVNRANRHTDRQILDTTLGAPDADLDDAAEQRLAGVVARPGKGSLTSPWVKCWPDATNAATAADRAREHRSRAPA